MNNLKLLRTRSNLTLRKLGEYVDMKHAVLQLLETGQRKFNEYHLLKLCYFFDVTTEFLLGYQPNGIGVYFETADDDNDHEMITLDELTELSKKYKVEERITASNSKKEFLWRFQLPDHEFADYTGIYHICRYVPANKEDTNISKTVAATLKREIDKLDIYDQEKLLKFLNEYIKK